MDKGGKKKGNHVGRLRLFPPTFLRGKEGGGRGKAKERDYQKGTKGEKKGEGGKSATLP